MSGKGSDRAPDSTANLEQHSRNELERQDALQAFSSPVCITVHSIRRRLADSDGISAKAAIDGIVKAGILEDDSPTFVKEVRHSQEQGTDEKTIITIETVGD